MKNRLKNVIPNLILEKRNSFIKKRDADKLAKRDYERFLKHSFNNDKKITYSQMEARITKEYHSIEKGLSYSEFRYGFGKNVLTNLIQLLNEYIKKGYPLDTHVFQTALSNLKIYIDKHDLGDYPVHELKDLYQNLSRAAEENGKGGTYYLTKEEIEKHRTEDFKQFSNSRHSFREFSNEPVALEDIEKALELAQNTPSACNRQPWKVRVVVNETLKGIIRKNQNGNRGFGDYIDKIIVITSDVQYYDRLRERNQANIDGGMYAMNLLYSLHYYNIATVPLSASLNIKQEDNIRKALNMDDSENFIMFIGVGIFAENFKVPKSDRRPLKYEIN